MSKVQFFNKDEQSALEDILNKTLPNSFEEIEELWETVSEALPDYDDHRDEWPIHPWHTGQRRDPNDWNSPMIVGDIIDLPYSNLTIVFNGFEWSVEVNEEVVCEWFEEKLTDDDISTWHQEAEATEHARALIAEAAVEGIEIWGSRTGAEPLSVDLL